MKNLNSNEAIRKVARFLSGKQIWVVGGAVRDRLMKRPITDIDLICLQDPHDWALALAKEFKGSAFRLDDHFAITRVSLGPLQLDLARIQGPNLEADLDRRDFSINSLAVPLQEWFKKNWATSVIDRHEGRKALKAKKIEQISTSIFKKDSLRLLRAFRIAAELNFSIAPGTLQSVKREARRLRTSAPERIREEMMKLFCTPRSYFFVRLMEKTALLDCLFPVFKPMRKVGEVYYGKGGVLTHTIESLKQLEEVYSHLGSWFPKCKSKLEDYLSQSISGYPRSAQLKWGILLHDIGKPDTAKIMDGRLRFFEHEHVGADKIPNLSEKFRWSSDEENLYGRLVRNHMRAGNLATHPEISEKALHRYFRDLGEDAIGMLLVSLGDHLSYLTPRERQMRRSPHEKITQRMVKLYYLQRSKVLPPRLVDGNDLMRAFDLKPSPLIGELLRAASEAQAEGKVSSKADILAFLKSKLAAMPPPTTT